MLLLDPMLFGEDAGTGLPLVAIAIDRSAGPTVFVTVDIEGRVRSIPEAEFITDYRWTRERGWYDAAALEEEAKGR